MSGLTDQGLVIKRLPEVIRDLQDSEKQNISNDISTSDDTIIGQLNNIFGESLAALWELIEVVHDNSILSRAEGQGLDSIGNSVGVPRLRALPSRGFQRIVTTSGGVLPAGFLFKNPSNERRYATIESREISLTNCYSATFALSDVLASNTYSATVEGVTYSYTSGAGDTANVILTGLAAALNAPLDKVWTATVDTVSARLKIETDGTQFLNISDTQLLDTTQIVYDIYVEAIIDGPFLAPANTITSAVNSFSGLVSTTNPNEFTLGRYEETDEEYRRRIQKNLVNLNGSTELSVISNILLLDGVVSVSVQENPTNVTVGSLPPHSFTAFVAGGDNTEIAQTIWRVHPLGIQTAGNTSVAITTESGLPVTVYFSRNDDVNIAVKVVYTLYDEETFPTGGETLIKTVVKEYIEALAAGTDIIPSRLFGPIYTNVPGIDSLVVSVQVIAESGDTPDELDWQTTKLSVAATDKVVIELQDIYVSEA